MYFEERKDKCSNACNACLEECISFEKEYRKTHDKIDIVRLVKVFCESCKTLISDGCSAINLLIECAKACDDLVSECGKHDVKYCLAIDECYRKCKDLCNAIKNATIWIIRKAKYQNE